MLFQASEAKHNQLMERPSPSWPCWLEQKVSFITKLEIKKSK